MKPIVWICVLMAVLSFGLLNGFGNLDGSVSLDKNQKAELVKMLGSYSGQAHAERIMGAMMTGVSKVTFLHDDEDGWGSPSTAIADVKLYEWSANGKYDLKAEGSFSDSEPDWLITIDGISLTSGQAKNTISLCDMSAYAIKLQRE
jgi:hypothetical protein